MIEISENVNCIGTSNFFRAVAVPICEEIKLIADIYPELEPPNKTKKSSEPNAQANITSELVGIIGITTFISTWTATTLLNEIYNLKLAPMVKEKLQRFLRDTEPKKKYAMTISTTNRISNCSLVIACVGGSIEEIEQSEKNVSSVLKYAQTFDDSDYEGKVLLFTLDGDVCNLTPEIHKDFSEATMRLAGLYPVKVPAYARNES